MEPYLVSARKYRPATFESVVGQKALISTLKNAVSSGRLANSYLFCGSRGVGKTSCARIFAKTINCEHRTANGEACNECTSCKSFDNGTSMNIIELDAASNNGVDDIRALIEQVQVPPSQGRYRVFIIDEVHMLSTAAFNSFLKTLEEPPSYVIFILATTEKHKIIPTILSRCQIYDFHRITIPDIIDHLKYVASCEGIATEEAALNVIARKADGAMRDALSIFDQVAASCAGNVTYQATIENLNVLDYGYYSRLLDAFLAGDIMTTWLIYKEIRDAGFDSHFFINGLALYLRDLMVARDPSTLSLLEAGDEAKADMAAAAARCTPGFLYRAMELCNEADLNYRTAASKQFLVELTLAKICQSLRPSPEGSGGEGQLKPIHAAVTAQSNRPTPESAAPSTPAATATSAPTLPPMPAQSAPKAPMTRPSTAPAMTTSVPVTPRNHTTLRTPKVSLRNGLAKPQQNASDTTAPSTARNASYTEAQLQEAWSKYAAEHPKERILSNTMRASTPVSDTGGHYHIAVANEMQLEIVTAALPDINGWLRNALCNDSISVSAAIDQSATTPRHTLNDRELVAELVKENPILADFIETLNLRLG